MTFDLGEYIGENRSNANQTTECSSMLTPRPAARPPHPFFELRAHPFDMLPPCLIFLDGDGPADPLVARERRYVFPCRECLRVGRERLLEISRKIMDDSSGDLNGCHRAISQAKESRSDTRLQLGFPDYRRLSGLNRIFGELLPDSRLQVSRSCGGRYACPESGILLCAGPPCWSIMELS